MDTSKKLIGVWHRIYSDFFMPSRLDKYRLILERALERDYRVCSIERFWENVKANNVEPGVKRLILRHDIDSDVSCARAMWEIEHSLGIFGSYYFRLSTIDYPLMLEIAGAGGEASYHFEEIATVAKQKGLSTKEQVYREMPYIQELFRHNLEQLRNKIGLPMRIVASHGDFVNRRLKAPNWLLLEDMSFRRDVGVELEVYDNIFMKYVTSRHADTHYPKFWQPTDPLAAINNEEPVVYLLVHPRHWCTNILVNVADDIRRVWEDIAYRLRIKNNKMI